MTEIAEHRIGQPSPLPFHLAAAVTAYQAAIIAAPKVNDPTFPWHGYLKSKLPDFSVGLDQIKLAELSYERLQSFTSGLRKWQEHSFKRSMTEPPAIWQHGSSRLLDFGACDEATNPRGKTMVVVPSLINKSHILDLGPNCSLLRFMASKGLRPMLLDWGDSAQENLNNDFNSYIYDKLQPAVKAASSSAGTSVGMLGYCMGGTLVAGLLASETPAVSAFASIGSPWDFSANRGVASGFRLMGSGDGEARITETLDNLGECFGLVPSDVFQSMFATINPMQAAVKFAKFDKMDQSSERAKTFVAIEDWLADGLPMTTAAAKNLLIDWNVKNQTANRQWKLAGKTVDIGSIDMPTMMICGTKDCISPIGVASAMAKCIPNSQLLTPELGHVGMIVSERAKAKVWQPLVKFFAKNLSN